ncbi:putative Myotubularin-related protein 14 [Paratrimastix pyriformis]|uniref:Myotubularin-related protein 14 n=1 Tax=Paratrimastix pyriformis TaxID=342808 RepID=A0ABQ8UJV5_9EUKA|nr:putative Myotubularin-related protein 14 [Paratrimastix pyriformis]
MVGPPTTSETEAPRPPEPVPYHFADDCFISLFDFIESLSDYLRLRTLNRRFWHLTSFWHRFDLTSLPCAAKLTTEAFTQLMTRCPYVTYINLDLQKMLNRRVNTPAKVDAMLAALPKLCPCLRQLDLRQIEPSLTAYTRIPGLESLYLDLNSSGLRPFRVSAEHELTSSATLTSLTLHEAELAAWYQYDGSRLEAGQEEAIPFVQTLAQLLPNLRTLSFSRGQCDVRFVDGLLRCCGGQLRRLDLRGVILTYDGSPQIFPMRGISKPCGLAADRLFHSLVPELGGTPAQPPLQPLVGVEELDLGNTRCTDEVLRRVGLLFPNLRRLSVFGCALLGADMLLELAGRPLARTLEWLNLSAPPYHEVRAGLSMGLLRRTVPHDEAPPPPGCSLRGGLPPAAAPGGAAPLAGQHPPQPPPVRPFVEAEADTTHRQLVLAQFPRVQFIGSAEIDAFYFCLFLMAAATVTIAREDVVHMIRLFSQHHVSSDRNNEEMLLMQQKVAALFSRDFEIALVDNRAGNLCSSYPFQLVILEAEKARRQPVPATATATATTPSQHPGDSDGLGVKLTPQWLQALQRLDIVGSSPAESSPAHPASASPPTGLLRDLPNPVEMTTRSRTLAPLIVASRTARVRTRFPIGVLSLPLARVAAPMGGMGGWRGGPVGGRVTCEDLLVPSGLPASCFARIGNRWVCRSSTVSRRIESVFNDLASRTRRLFSGVFAEHPDPAALWPRGPWAAHPAEPVPLVGAALSAPARPGHPAHGAHGHERRRARLEEPAAKSPALASQPLLTWEQTEEVGPGGNFGVGASIRYGVAQDGRAVVRVEEKVPACPRALHAAPAYDQDMTSAPHVPQLPPMTMPCAHVVPGSASDPQDADVALLKAWGVEAILDLMVENKKKKTSVPFAFVAFVASALAKIHHLIRSSPPFASIVMPMTPRGPFAWLSLSRFGFDMCTSEKSHSDPRKYGDPFRILQMPYPGCEFFALYREHNHQAAGLMFNWADPAVNAELSVGALSGMSIGGIRWADYKRWDLVELTQNYMDAALETLARCRGILVHCISGWDRTPLFISLLRILAWADGLAHGSLSPLELLYLTLAYDWFLFGHHFEDRLRKGEDIAYFCFESLGFLADPRPAFARAPDVAACLTGDSPAWSPSAGQQPQPLSAATPASMHGSSLSGSSQGAAPDAPCPCAAAGGPAGWLGPHPGGVCPLEDLADDLPPASFGADPTSPASTSSPSSAPSQEGPAGADDDVERMVPPPKAPPRAPPAEDVPVAAAAAVAAGAGRVGGQCAEARTRDLVSTALLSCIHPSTASSNPDLTGRQRARSPPSPTILASASAESLALLDALPPAEVPSAIPPCSLAPASAPATLAVTATPTGTVTGTGTETAPATTRTTAPAPAGTQPLLSASTGPAPAPTPSRVTTTITDEQFRARLGALRDLFRTIYARALDEGTLSALLSPAGSPPPPAAASPATITPTAIPPAASPLMPIRSPRPGHARPLALGPLEEGGADPSRQSTVSHHQPQHGVGPLRPSRPYQRGPASTAAMSVATRPRR